MSVHIAKTTGYVGNMSGWGVVYTYNVLSVLLYYFRIERGVLKLIQICMFCLGQKYRSFTSLVLIIRVIII